VPRIGELVVDCLPRRLWWPANHYLGFRLHFCVGAGRRHRMVRTVEWNGHDIARGYRPWKDWGPWLEQDR
jgi:hypothetical protein